VLRRTSRNNVTEAELAKIYEYKKKLIAILNKLKNRETSMSEVAIHLFSWLELLG